jgi:hypothetical protein
MAASQLLPRRLKVVIPQHFQPPQLVVVMADMQLMLVAMAALVAVVPTQDLAADEPLLDKDFQERRQLLSASVAVAVAPLQLDSMEVVDEVS